jgi:DNA-binding transcriptional LysR family regulator
MDMSVPVELRHLRYFVAVAEELHFGRAAARLHLAQPPLSQQIRKLEELVGHALFTRTSRAVRLTAAGEALLERARHTLRKVEEDVETTRSVGRGELGSLTVGFIGSAMLTPLPEILGRYRREYPRVNLRLREHHTAGVIEMLLDGTADVGFLRDGDPTEGLVLEEVWSEPFVVALPRKHPRSRAASLGASQLRDEPFVLFPRGMGHRAYDTTISLCEERGFRPHVVQEAPQWLTILRLVGAGLGVTLAPACVAPLATPAAICRRLRGTLARSHVELAYRAGDDRAVVKAFRAIARDGFAGHRQPRRASISSMSS